MVLSPRTCVPQTASVVSALMRKQLYSRWYIPSVSASGLPFSRARASSWETIDEEGFWPARQLFSLTSVHILACNVAGHHTGTGALLSAWRLSSPPLPSNVPVVSRGVARSRTMSLAAADLVGRRRFCLVSSGVCAHPFSTFPLPSTPCFPQPVVQRKDVSFQRLRCSFDLHRSVRAMYA